MLLSHPGHFHGLCGITHYLLFRVWAGIEGLLPKIQQHDAAANGRNFETVNARAYGTGDLS